MIKVKVTCTLSKCLHTLGKASLGVGLGLGCNEESRRGIVARAEANIVLSDWAEEMLGDWVLTGAGGRGKSRCRG
jgi:hypothetical protein